MSAVAAERAPLGVGVGGVGRALRVGVVTGTRAEWGLLKPVVRGLAGVGGVELCVVVAGSHLVGPAMTWGEVARECEAEGWRIAGRVEMQREGESGRGADAAALGRGVSGFAGVFGACALDWAVVLGDRIEALAAATAASVGGIGVAHVHGGDRASGVADEGMRHAISKLAHVHFAATAESGARLLRMGEEPWRVRVVGSPAADGAGDVVAALPAGVGEGVRVCVLMHGSGLGDGEERAWARAVVEGVEGALGGGEGWVYGASNLDAGSGAVAGVLGASGGGALGHVEHGVFRGFLKWLGERGGVLVGNSSAGLIEAPMLGCASVDVGLRQDGRERGASVEGVAGCDAGAVAAAIGRARGRAVVGDGRYGDGGAGARIAGVLGSIDPGLGGFLRKRNAY